MSNRLWNLIGSTALNAKSAFRLWAFLTATFASCVAIGSLAYVLIVVVTEAEDTKLWIGPAGVGARHRTPRWMPKSVTSVVHPYGWQYSRLRLEKGKRYRFDADGRVTLDMAGTFQAGLARYEFERIRVGDPHAAALPLSHTSPPEDDFSANELLKLSIVGRWTGPDGYEPGTAVSKLRASRRLLPGASLGVLIGQLRHGDCAGAQSEPFVIGEHAELEVQCSAELWLSVNEVAFPSDPQLFNVDNAGVFRVSVTAID